MQFNAINCNLLTRSRLFRALCFIFSARFCFRFRAWFQIGIKTKFAVHFYFFVLVVGFNGLHSLTLPLIANGQRGRFSDCISLLLNLARVSRTDKAITISKRLSDYRICNLLLSENAESIWIRQSDMRVLLQTVFNSHRASHLMQLSFILGAKIFPPITLT